METTDTLKERAYRHIRRKLLVGAFAPGIRLSDRSLARELGLGRMPVREAVRRLEWEGLVHKIPRSGTYVRQRSDDEMADMCQLREVLEIFAAGQAATRITAAQLRQLRRSCRAVARLARGVAAGDYAAWPGELAERAVDSDAAFHNTLLAAAGNRQMADVVDGCQLLAAAFDWQRRLPTPVDVKLHESLMRTYREHMDIVEALEQGDPQAARAAIRRHLLLARPVRCANEPQHDSNTSPTRKSHGAHFGGER